MSFLSSLSMGRTSINRTPVPTFQDNLTSSGATSHTSNGVSVGGWTTNDYLNVKVNGTNDVIDYSGKRDATLDSISKSLGYTADDTAWVLRFLWRCSALTQGADCQMAVVLADGDYTVGASTTNHDAVGFGYTWNDIGSFGIVEANGSFLNIVLADENASIAFAIDTDYFIEVIRLTSTSVQIKIFTESTYTTQNGTTATSTIDSTLGGLTYLKIYNRNLASCCSGSLASTLTDFKIWDGVTSAP